MKPPEDCASIEDVRRGIDALDRDKTSEADVRAPDRRLVMLEERRQWAEQEGPSPDAIQKLYEAPIDHLISREP